MFKERMFKSIWEVTTSIISLMMPLRSKPLSLMPERKAMFWPLRHLVLMMRLPKRDICEMAFGQLVWCTTMRLSDTWKPTTVSPGMGLQQSASTYLICS